MGKTYKGPAGKARARAPPHGERVTRSSKAKLTNGLDDPAQVERDLNAQLKLMGLYAANTIGDGNCLFRALSDQLYGYPNHHAQLRHEVCEYLAASPEKYAGFVDDQPFDTYVRLMRESGTYGGHLELSAFVQLKKKLIKVVQPGLVYVVSSDDESPAAIRERERKEEERQVRQNSVPPGTEGPPPSERERRRLRREEKMRKKDNVGVTPSASAASTTSAASTAREMTVGAAEEKQEGQSSEANDLGLVEAFGPLYIAYHNWEHYSSIRNLDGPHTGLPRIKERPISVVDGPSDTKGKGKASGKEGDSEWVDESEAEPTEDEKLVLASTVGHGLAEIRQLMQETSNDWEKVVETLIERDAAVDIPQIEAQRSGIPEIPTASEGGQQSRPMETFGAQLQPPSNLPEHLRQWRATSPSSVDTVGTQSSGSAASTAPTTDEGPDTGGAVTSPEAELSRSSSPGIERLSSKRAASTGPTEDGLPRSPKRRSRSRSPSSPRNDGPVETASAARPTQAPAHGSVASSVATIRPYESRTTQSQLVSDTAAAGAATMPAPATPATPFKRGPGRPRKDGLPPGSVPKVKPPSAREKRDAAKARKHARQLQRFGRADANGDANAGAGEERSSATPARAKSSAEVQGFRELKI